MDGIIQNSAWDSECTRFLPSVFLWEKAPVHDMIPRYHQKECEHGKVLLNGIVYEDKDATDANKSRLLLEAQRYRNSLSPISWPGIVVLAYVARRCRRPAYAGLLEAIDVRCRIPAVT